MAINTSYILKNLLKGEMAECPLCKKGFFEQDEIGKAQHEYRCSYCNEKITFYKKSTTMDTM